MRLRTRILCGLSLIALLAPTAHGDGTIEEVRYPPSEKPGELVYGVTYRVWIPDGVTQLRGVIVHQHGCGAGACHGGMTAADDLHWQGLARKWDCALLGPFYEQKDGEDCQMWCNPNNGSRARFLQALDDLAKKTGHSELAQVPWCLWGHSGGGTWTSWMMLSDPDRVVAAWLRSGTAFPFREKGSDKTVEIPDSVYKIPSMCNPGAKERNSRPQGAWGGTLSMFKAYRAHGAPIGFAPDPRTGHECGDSRYLAIPFFDACLAQRLPPKGVDSPKVLPLVSASSWLAPLLGEEARPESKYEDDPGKAVWLPDEHVAKAWVEYVRTGAVGDSTPPPPPFDVKVSKAPGGGVEITWDAHADLESGLRQFVIRRDGQEIARLPEKPIGRFGRPLFQTMSYHDSPEAPVPSMRAVDKSDGAGGESSYQVISINSVGQKSEPSSAARLP